MPSVIRAFQQSYLVTFPLCGPRHGFELRHTAPMARRPYSQASHDDLLLLRRERLKRGLSIEDAAAGIGISKQQLQRMETGVRNISLKWLLQIADFYEIPVGQLVRDGDGLTDEERELIEFLRTHPQDGKILLTTFRAMNEARKGEAA